MSDDIILRYEARKGYIVDSVDSMDSVDSIDSPKTPQRHAAKARGADMDSDAAGIAPPRY